MTNFFLRLLFAVLFISGVWTLFRPDMLLQKLGDWIEYYVRQLWKEDADFILKPLKNCPPCMSSLYGSTIWFAFGGSWLGWLPFIVCLCGALSLIFNAVKFDV